MKILSSDYDGTLFFGEYRPEDIESIKRFQKNGNQFVINSGRALFQLEEQMEGEHPFKIDGYICDSGATVANSRKEILSRTPIPFELFKEMILPYPDVDITFNVSGRYSTLKPSRRFDPFGPVHYVPDLESIEKEPVTSVSYYFDTMEEAQEHAKKLKEKNLPLSIQVNRTSVDCVLEGRSKREGLLDYLEKADVPVGNSYAIGDSWNDVPALLAAGHGFLMDSAPEELKKQLAGKNVRLVPSIAAAIEKIEEEELCSR